MEGLSLCFLVPDVVDWHHREGGREGEKPEAGRLGTRKLIWKPEVVAAKLCRPSVRSGRLSGGAPKAGSFPWRMRPKQSGRGRSERRKATRPAKRQPSPRSTTAGPVSPATDTLPPPVNLNPRRSSRKGCSAGVKAKESGCSFAAVASAHRNQRSIFFRPVHALMFSVTGSGDKQCVIQLE